MSKTTIKKIVKVCKIKNCNGKYCAKGYCWKHYNQMRLYGKILAEKSPALLVTYTCKNCGIIFIPPDHPERPRTYCSNECHFIYERAHSTRKTDREYYDKHFSIPGNREKKREMDRKYRAKNREKMCTKAKGYYLANKSEIKKKWKQGYTKAEREKKKAYYFANKAAISKNHTKWCAKQRKENPAYRLHDNITSQLSHVLSIGKGGRRTSEILGYSIDDLKKRLESKFTTGMTWDNYGEWQVDHIIPVSAHNFKTPDDIDFKRCWALKNLQPLWAEDNMLKRAKLSKPFQPSLLLSVE